LLSGCIQNPEETEPDVSSVPVGDVVPIIQYPDVYLVSQGFGFNLPQGWSSVIDQDDQIIRFTSPPYTLSLYFNGQHTMSQEILTGIGSLSSTIEIDGFWGDTIMDKHHLVGGADGSTMVLYLAQDALNGIWLTAYLECLGEDCTEYIPDEIETQVDWLLASYEEHGWEE
jgi:hypothetical protein